MEPEIIQRFLESVGAKADIDLYLKLFRAQRKESFAILAPNAAVSMTGSSGGNIKGNIIVNAFSFAFT